MSEKRVRGAESLSARKAVRASEAKVARSGDMAAKDKRAAAGAIESANRQGKGMKKEPSAKAKSAKGADAPEGTARKTKVGDKTHSDNKPVTPQVKKSRKESRSEQRKTVLERREKKRHAQIIADMRAHWEPLRSTTISAKERRPHVEAVLRLARGRVSVLALRSDASRILQCAASHCSADERAAMALEVCAPVAQDGEEIPRQAASVSALASSTAALHLVAKLVRDCPVARATIVEHGVSGRVERLLMRKEGLKLLDLVYDELNATARLKLLLEAYLPSAGVLGDTGPIPKDAVSVHDVVRALPHKRDVVLASLRTKAAAFVAKERLSFHVAQRLFADRLALEAPALVAVAVALVAASADALRALTSSSEGCEALVRIVAAATAKERRGIVKALKGHVAAMLADVHQAQVVMACLLLVDDTVLLAKALVPEVTAALRAGLSSGEPLPRGIVRTVLALVAGRRANHITNQFEALLSSCACSSQKDAETRRAELFAEALSSIDDAAACALDRLAADQHALHIPVEVAAHAPESRCAAALSARVQSSSSSLAEAMRGSTPEGLLLRAMVQRSEPLARAVLDLALRGGAESFRACFAADTGAGYLLVSMLRHEALAAAVRERAADLEGVESPTARLLLSRL